VLVAQTSGGSTTTYAQDLVAPLSQVLETNGVPIFYGHERLALPTSSTLIWFLHDGLGSVRQTLDGSGGAPNSVSYDPWGVPQGGLPLTLSGMGFGFTGELQNAASGLVHLRARWYDANAGRFHARDPFEGWAETPYSQHFYQYAYSNPVNWTDLSGRCVGSGCRPSGDGVDLVFGFLEQWAYVNSFGTAQDLAPLNCDTLAELIGRHLGNAAGVIQGLIHISAGGAAAGGGGLICATGVGCIVGAPAVGVGAAVASHGASVAGFSAAQSVGMAARVLMSTRNGDNGDTTVPRRDVDDQDAVGGHTVERHVGKSENWLRQRLQDDPDLNFASSFNNWEAANRTIGRYVNRNRPNTTTRTITPRANDGR
jgi:RHS repeat-associated protein